MMMMVVMTKMMTMKITRIKAGITFLLLLMEVNANDSDDDDDDSDDDDCDDIDDVNAGDAPQVDDLLRMK
jgi:hypothetical protein